MRQLALAALLQHVLDAAVRLRVRDHADVRDAAVVAHQRPEHHAGAPLSGFYTWGEIARTRGITGYHNQTLAVLAVG